MLDLAPQLQPPTSTTGEAQHVSIPYWLLWVLEKLAYVALISVGVLWIIMLLWLCNVTNGQRANAKRLTEIERLLKAQSGEIRKLRP